ncbi:UNVERIFIED_CONTAM: histidine kinase [Methylobacteriaceae bacterium AG10]|nr:histidine kinase [Methylobacteriaceae bacterium AG10]
MSIAGPAQEGRAVRRPCSIVLLWSVWIVTAGALAVPTALWALRTREAALAAAHDEVVRATEAGARATENVVGLVDVLLKQLSKVVGDGGLDGTSVDKPCPSPPCSNAQRLSPDFVAVVARASGEVVATGPDAPPVSVADRDYFVAQKEQDTGLYVGLPRRTPFAEGEFLPLSRRLASKDGTFTGIVAADINTTLVSAIFEGQGTGRIDRMQLLDEGGRVLVDWAMGEGGPAASARSGTCGLPGPAAEGTTMASTIPITLGGLAVIGCRSTEGGLRPWRKGVAVVAGIEAVFLLAMAALVPVASRYRQRRPPRRSGLSGPAAGTSDIQFIVAAKPNGTFVLEALTFSTNDEWNRTSLRLVGRTTRELFPAHEADLVDADYRSVLASGETRRIERRISLGGNQFVWSTLLVPLRNTGGGYIFGAASDLGGNTLLDTGLRGFTEDVLRREDDERRRIARELHDTTGQNLIAAGFELDVVARGLVDPSPPVRIALAEARRLVDDSVAELRTLSYVLYPPLLDEAGLGLALTTLAEGFGKRAGMGITVSVAAEVVGRRWAPEVELALYRVAQEALTNVRRHSSAKAARVRLATGAQGELALEIENDVGEAPTLAVKARPFTEGAGIRGMRDRLEALSGSLSVMSHQDGFRVAARVPAHPMSRGARGP